MTPDKRPANRILWYEGIGFSMIIGLSWLDELFEFPRQTFGLPSRGGNWHEAAIESLLVLAVAAVTMTTTRRLLARLYHLEGFLRVCSWCRELDLGGRWVRLEEYFRAGLDTCVTHSICESCAKRANDELPVHEEHRGAGAWPPEQGG